MKYIIFCLLIITSISAQAQDILVKKSGEEIQVKVLEVTPVEIKYRNFGNPEGPVFTISKSDVFMIKYENGERDVFSNVPQKNTVEVTPIKSTPDQDVPPAPRPVNLSGPRLGITVITPGEIADKLDEYFGAKPIVSQFGWQFETRFFTLPDGMSGVFEVVPLIAGVEQGMFLPSISTLIGIRSAKGMEFGVGPNLSLAGAALVIAAGVTFSSEYVNFPVNIAVVPSSKGTRVSLLFGFNYRKN